ncbi:thiamine-phosphate kinase [methane-oxidizing endosymbiont of Gigantopelta aegis]|uniref:thiamine-phosphate kinase n=1 Tax=methane-oxidizing endosymbiont of Gigantopelta aegis TaxID=2794938 RepID=UPI0018DEAA91|nr:thiamine-phosphate kinase [methane-oxidizing endosymbiont of Gigantopelta aegis]
MSAAEFDLIARFFDWPAKHKLNRLSVGDDCALCCVPAGHELAVTTDTMVAGVHFFETVKPAFLGHKLLAVNLSDLASMGAEPFAVTLALTLPRVDEDWLADFSAGLRQLAERYSVDLIGGDTTSGPLTLTLQAMGIVPEGLALRRDGAQPGDLIYVTGTLGGGGLGLKIAQGYQSILPEMALQRFHCPEPQLKHGLALRGIASACIDISDGLAQDLGHILAKSNVGACLDWEQIPLSASVRDYIEQTGDWQLPISGGDDYQLCFTVPPEKQHQLTTDYTRIGVIEAQPGLRINRQGKAQTIQAKGYEHFS